MSTTSPNEMNVADSYEDEGSAVSVGASGAAAFIVSLSLHVVLLGALFFVKLPNPQEVATMLLGGLSEENEKEVSFDTTKIDQLGSNSDIKNAASAGGAIAQLKSDEPRVEIERPTFDDAKGPEIKVNAKDEMLPNRAEITGLVEVSGTGTENVGGLEGSIDRLTLEIAASLRQKKTLVVWLFDASQSLRERRGQIADRFENVYRQLGAMDVGAEKALKTGVLYFGNNFKYIADTPVDDIRSVVDKVRRIPDDDSGKENVFAAIGSAVSQYRTARSEGRNVMFIIVTDERGDDAGPNLDAAIVACKRAGIRVYTVGHASPFGREVGFVTWTYPDKSTEDLPVDAGPESFFPEVLRLGFWGGPRQDLDKLSAGYGPYALTRLCKETGGLYFIADERGPRFDPAIMRNYQPDYSPIRDQQKNLEKSNAKKLLVMACERSRLDSIPIPTLSFRSDTDNRLRELITESQRPAALLDAKITELLTILTPAEKERDKLTEPRWKASFDLAMGRLLAMKVRALGYNSMLAEMKASPKPFEKKGNNHWDVVPSKEILSGPQVKKIEKSALTYLRRVVDEHGGTPWALIAERELASPLGWDWKEKHVDYAGQEARAAAAKKALQLADDDPKKKAQKKMMTQPKAKPKL